MRTLVISVALAVLATACGGGGGGGGSSSWLTFSPSSLSATVTQGQSTTLSLTATAGWMPDVQVHPALGLDDAVFQASQVSITQAPGDLSLTAELLTVPSLAVGDHDGVIEVRVCQDAALTCAQPYADSPWHVPYHIHVAAP